MEVYVNMENVRATIGVYDRDGIEDFSVSSHPAMFGDLINGISPYSAVSLMSRNSSGILIDTLIFDLAHAISPGIVKTIYEKYRLIPRDFVFTSGSDDFLSEVSYRPAIDQIVPKIEVSTCGFGNPHSLGIFKSHNTALSKVISELSHTTNETYSLHLGDFEIVESERDKYLECV